MTCTREEDSELVAADAGTAGAVGRGLDKLVRDLLQKLIAGKVAVKVVDALEMVEVEQEQRSGSLGLHRAGQGVHQFAAISEAGRGVGVGVPQRELLRCLIGVESFLQVLRAAPSEEDDRDVQKESDGERPVILVEMIAANSGRHHGAAQRDEQDDRRGRRQTGYEMAARNANSPI